MVDGRSVSANVVPAKNPKSIPIAAGTIILKRDARRSKHITVNE